MLLVAGLHRLCRALQRKMSIIKARAIGTGGHHDGILVAFWWPVLLWDPQGVDSS